MTEIWQRCPHCDVYFETRHGSELADACPSCGKTAIATTQSVPATGGALQATFDSRHDVLSEAQVVPEAANCVQCGMCSYNCPMEIDVRAHAWRGLPIRDSHCLTCSECVNRCPRGVLRFERIPLFVFK
jgi:ferredoxin